MDFKKWSWVIIFLVSLSSLSSFECAAFQDKGDQLDKEALFQLLDRNKDGKINLEEFQTIWKDKDAAKRAFRGMDLNDDGYLSREEFGKPGTVLFTW